MTGWGRGYCGGYRSEQGPYPGWVHGTRSSGYGRGFWRGRAFGWRRGPGRGFARGFGRGRGYGSRRFYPAW
ncbi:MAG: hypothetical protein P8175_19135 [Deltaproteobacteria bacterium]